MGTVLEIREVWGKTNAFHLGSRHSSSTFYPALRTNGDGFQGSFTGFLLISDWILKPLILYLDVGIDHVPDDI